VDLPFGILRADTRRPSDLMPLDRFDRAILERYQRDTLVPAKTIGDAVGLSAAAVQRRLKRLRAEGVIERESAVLSPKALGMMVTCIVAVDLDREGSADLDRFRREMTRRPEVQQCYYVTGHADFILVVLTPDMEAYDRFTRETLMANSNVRSFTTQVVLERVKVNLDVPIASGGEA
jgi:Lrp/AsnC family transcriptional regulator, leucine-responsive regulatory protein